MVDFGESDKMVKLSGKVDKSNTENRFSPNKERNITIKLVASVLFIHFFTYFNTHTQTHTYTYIYNCNPAIMAHHIGFYIKVIFLDSLTFVSSVYHEMISLWCFHTSWTSFLINSRCKKDNYEMVIRNFHFYLNRSINIIMEVPVV